MAAVFNVYFDFGGVDGTPGTNQNTDALGPPNVRFKTNDDATIDAVNPIPIPESGTKYSYWKHIYLRCATAPDTQVNNIKFYTDASGFGTGIAVKVGDETPVKNSGASTGYDVATGTPGDTGTEMVAGHSEITASTDAFSFTSAAPKSVTISESGSIINAIGETSNYIVLQMEVISTATPGDLANEVATWRYDEI